MATSTILDAISIDNERSAKIIIDALEEAERIPIHKSNSSLNLTTDPDSIRRIASKAMAATAIL